MKRWRVGFAVLLVVALVVGGAWQTAARADDAFGLISEVMKLVQREYWRGVDAQTLIRGALKGIMESLNDPHSTYMPPVNYGQFIEQATGAYGGLGIRIEVTPDGLLVTQVFRNSPAAKAGLKALDVILFIGDKDTRHLLLEEITGLLRGELGTEVTISYYRGKVSNFHTVTMARDMVVAPSATWREHEGYAYIYIERFGEGLREDIEEALKELANTKGVILDMRGCPGGLLESLEAIAPYFVKGQVLGQIMHKGGKTENVYIRGALVSPSKPLVVLVDGRTASAAEILTGAIQDSKAGFVIGEKTYGKGVAQSIYSLGQNIGGIKITVLGYLTPLGRMIEGKGLEPDLEVKRAAPQFLPPLSELISDAQTLKVGARGVEVTKLQKALIALGFMDGVAKGHYDSATARAVIRFQQKEGLLADGTATPEVIELINTKLVRPPVFTDAPLEAAVVKLKELTR